jgi:hypothetical protein
LYFLLQQGEKVSATLQDTGKFMHTAVQVVSESLIDLLNFHVEDWHKRHDWDNFRYKETSLVWVKNGGVVEAAKEYKWSEGRVMVNRFSNFQFRTLYWHRPITFKPFSGFQAKQLRLRATGSDLGLHMDRASAKLTVLYYPNNDWEGGELVYGYLKFGEGSGGEGVGE